MEKIRRPVGTVPVEIECVWAPAPPAVRREHTRRDGRARAISCDESQCMRRERGSVSIHVAQHGAFFLAPPLISTLAVLADAAAPPACCSLLAFFSSRFEVLADKAHLLALLRQPQLYGALGIRVFVYSRIGASVHWCIGADEGLRGMSGPIWFSR